MIQRVQSLSYHYDGRLELHVIGGFQDSRRIAVDLAVPLLRKSLFLVPWWWSSGYLMIERPWVQYQRSLFS